MTREEQQERNVLEQHIGTVLQVMVIALLGWSLNTTVSLRSDVSVLQAQLSAVTSQLAQANTDRYLIAAIKSDVGSLERRIEMCEIPRKK
jgi:hypothetical protein